MYEPMVEWHFECIRNLSDLSVNLKKVLLVPNRDMLDVSSKQFGDPRNLSTTHSVYSVVSDKV